MSKSEQAWAVEWLDRVMNGSSKMSQRSLSFVEANGGLAQLRREAKARGVHLVLLVDDKGKELVAASMHPFKVIC